MGRTEAVIVATARTPMGRYGGQLKDLRPDDLAAIILQEACDRAHVKPGEVEDVILGCANQAGEDNRNVARMALLLAGFPVEVRGRPSTGCAVPACRRRSPRRARSRPAPRTSSWPAASRA